MKMSKRMAVVTAVLLALTVFAAGCQGTTDSNDRGDGDGGEAGISPEDPSMDEKCPVCGMMPAKHEEWQAQIVFRDGEHVHFDVPKDALTYYFAPEEYFPEGKTVDDVAEVYFTDYYTTEHVPMNDELFFVKGSDVTGPMGKDLIPVQGRDKVDSFVDDHGGEVYATSEVTASMVAGLKGDMDMDTMDGGMDTGDGEMDMDGGTLEEASGALDVPTGSICLVCGMMPAKYPEWNAQVVYLDGSGEFFCSPKDAWAYYFAPEDYGNRTANDIKEIYFTDHETGRFVAKGDLHFVNGSDAEGPMGKDLVPIKGQDAAQAFADEHGGTVYSSNEVTAELVMSLKMSGGMAMGGNSSMDSMDMEE